MSDDKLANQVKQLLDESVAGLDDATCRRLRQVRRQALAAVEPGPRRRWWLWGGVPTMVAALLLLLLWPQQDPATKRLLPVSEVFEPVLLTMEEPLDFYQEEMEFYEWLADVLETDQTFSPDTGGMGAPVSGAGRGRPTVSPAAAGSVDPGAGTARVPRHV